MVNVCRWCGEDTGSVRKSLCMNCKGMRTDYNFRIGHMFHTTKTSDLIKFRNMCMDMQELQRRGGVGLPSDIDYQLERVNRYLADKEDKHE